MKIRIGVDEMELIFDRLIQRIKNDNIEFVDVETDYYWIVTTDEWDNFTSPSPSAAVGSLVDDLLSLQNILKTAQVTYLDLERFASILRAVSETIAPSKEKIIEDNSP